MRSNGAEQAGDEARAEVARFKAHPHYECQYEALHDDVKELRERATGLAAALRALANACECTCGECPCQRIADDALEKFGGEK